MSSVLPSPFGSLEINGNLHIGSVGSWPLPLLADEVWLMQFIPTQAEDDID